MTSFEGFPNPIKGQEQPPEEEKVEDEEIAEIMDAINKSEPAIKMPDDDSAMEEKKKKEKPDNLTNENLAEMEEIMPPEVAREKDRTKQTEINKIKGQITANELDLKNSRNALDRLNGTNKQDKTEALRERIVYLENKKLELKDDLDVLEGREINSIDDIIGKEISAEKIEMKAGKGSKMHRGGGFKGACQREISIGGIVSIFSSETKKGLNTSRIKSIKKCEDGSYIVETNTSFYRLNIVA